jgi:hypothetical protein
VIDCQDENNRLRPVIFWALKKEAAETGFSLVAGNEVPKPSP